MEYTETEDSIIDFDHVDTGLVLMVTKNSFSKSVPLVTGTKELDYTIEKVPVADKENTYHITLTFSGTVDGLTEGTRYKLTVIGDENGKTATYGKEEIKTTSRVTEFRGISSHCTCDKDGMFRFSIDYTDENDFYSDFIYEFKNTEGETVRNGDIDDPHAEQQIMDVNQLPGSDYILMIRYYSSDPADIQTEQSETIYNDGGVTVEINKGTVLITCKVKI